MKDVAEVQIAPWDKKYYFFSEKEIFEEGNYVIVEGDFGEELGRIEQIKKFEEARDKCGSVESGAGGCSGNNLKTILRKATPDDLERTRQNESSKENYLVVCRELIKKHNLPMKLVDMHFSFEGSSITFAFIADGRIDFRELVKELTRKLQKSIRLHQIGVRDEAKIAGDLGPCGRGLCCRSVLKCNYGGVSTEMAFAQQIAHRGMERLAGACGRLKCCLRYELPMYEELREKLPQIDSEVKTKSGKGKVVGWEILKQVVKVNLEDGSIAEVPLNEIRK